MDQDVGDPVQALTNVQLHFVRQLMGSADGHIGIYLKVQIDVIFEAGLAGETLLHAAYTRNTECRFPDLRDQARSGP